MKKLNIMKSLIFLLLFIPLVSCDNAEVQSYYDSGEVLMTLNYVNGLEHGLKTFYYKSGKVSSTLNFINGSAEGDHTIYYESGEVESTALFINDKVVGLEKHYYKSGELKTTQKYVNGISEGKAKHYYKSGECYQGCQKSLELEKEAGPCKLVTVLCMEDLKIGCVLMNNLNYKY